MKNDQQSIVGPPSSEASWEQAWISASSSGCGFPGEVAGTALRTFDSTDRLSRQRIQLATVQQIQACDACNGECTATGRQMEDGLAEAH